MNTYTITTKQVHLIILLIKKLKQLHQSNSLQVLFYSLKAIIVAQFKKERCLMFIHFMLLS